MVEAARFSPSARNVQPLKYALYSTPEQCKAIFPTLAWAGYLTDWDGPSEGERPSAYILQLHDTTISDRYSCDHGITAQSILLQAVELGYGGCIIGAVKRDELSDLLHLPDHLKIINVLALGVPREKVVVDDMEEGITNIGENLMARTTCQKDPRRTYFYTKEERLNPMRFTFRLLPLILAAFMAFSCAPKQKGPDPRNPYGLEIINTYEGYSRAWLPIPTWNWWIEYLHSGRGAGYPLCY